MWNLLKNKSWFSAYYQNRIFFYSISNPNYEERVLVILFNRIWSSLLYNLHIFEAFVQGALYIIPFKNTMSMGAVNFCEPFINYIRTTPSGGPSC